MKVGVTESGQSVQCEFTFCSSSSSPQFPPEANVATRRRAIGHRLEVVQIAAAAGVLELFALALQTVTF